MNRFKLFSLTLIVAFFLFSVEILNAQNLNQTFKPGIAGIQGHIGNVARRADGKLVFSGSFEVINGVRQSLIAVVNEDGIIDETFNPPVFSNTVPQSTTSVGEIIPQPDGKIIILGKFTHIDGVAMNNFARLNVDGSLDTTFNIGTGADGSLYNVKLLADGKILVCGYFSTFNNQPYKRLIRLNSNGSIDSTFSLSLQYGLFIQNMVVQPDGKIVVIGDIYSEPAGDFVGIARINTNGTRDSSFNPGSSTDSREITTLALQSDGKILISGNFETYNGVARHGMARINSNGSLDTTFNARVTDSGFTETVTFLPQDNGQIIIGGGFKQVNGITQPYLARLNANGTLDASFAPALDQGFGSDTFVSPLFLLPDQKILISGSFVTINQSPYLGFAKINTDGTPDSSFRLHAKLAGTINALAIQNDGKTIIGGSFSSVNGIFNFGVARLNIDGSVDTDFNTGKGTLKTTIGIAGSQNGYITAIAIQNDGKIILGGSFGTFNDVHMNGLVRLNPDGSNDPTFPRSTLGGIIVNSIKIQPDNKILISGSHGIRRHNPDGTLDSGFDPGILDNQVKDFVIQPDGKIIIGGFFTNISGVAKNRIARLNANGSLDTSFTTGADSYINSVVQKNDGKIVIAGNFTSINGNSRIRIAQLNSDGSLDTTFNPGSGASHVIFKVLVQEDGKLLVAGNFNTFANLSRKKLVRLLPDGSLDSTFAANFEPFSAESAGSSIYALAQNGKKITLGGYFSKINNYKLSSIAQLQTSKTLFDFDGDSRTDIGIFRPTTGAWWINQSSNNVTTAIGFGDSNDRLIPADYTGDGKTDIASYRSSTGQWFILRSENYSFYGFQFGAPGDIPAPGDFDGDGKTDAAVFRPATASWYILRSSDGSVTSLQFGVAEDQPVVADYDGDGKDDIGVFRPTPAEWWIMKSTGGVFSVQFGQTGDRTVPGDYTGDGKADVAFWRPSNGTWYILRSEDFSFYGFPFGSSGDQPTPGDYDGDGKMDAGVFRDSNASWYLLRSTAGFTGAAFGNTNDRPIPNSFVR